MQPDQNGDYFYQDLGVSLRYHVTDCQLASQTRSCALLPGCFACLFATDDAQQVDYLGRLFAVPRESQPASRLAASEARFTFVYGNPSYYLRCAEGEESGVCVEIAREIEANSVVLEYRTVSELLRSASVVVEEVFVAVMVGVGVWEFVTMRRMKQMEVEMWKLYKEDQREYREIVNSMREDLEVSVDGPSEEPPAEE